MIIKDIELNKSKRLELLIKAKDNPELQEMLIKKCSEDCIFFINNFLWTYDPRMSPSTIPFITYEYQDGYINSIINNIENKQNNITEKSRDMGFSWMILSIFMRGFLFKGRASLIGSYKESYVDQKGNMDSSFERLRFMLEKLPVWMKPADINSYYMTINSQTLKSEIAGDAGENFGTGGRRKVVFMDEFALWQNARKAFRKIADVTPCMIIGGTPEGRSNIYGKIMTNHEDYNYLNIKKYTLHWTMHPKKTKDWYEEQKKNRNKIDIAKELDISYDDSVSGAVYPDINTLCRFEHLEYSAFKPTYTGRDFGKDMNAVIFVQKDWTTNVNYIIHSVQRKNRDIEKFLAFATGQPTNGYQYMKEDLAIIDKVKDWQYARHFGDPYNSNSTTTNATSSIKDILQKYGIYIETVINTGGVEERIKKVGMALKRLYIDEGQFDLIQSLIQSKYPEKNESSQATSESSKPIHNEFSHFRTAVEYYFDSEPMHQPGKNTNKRKPNNRNPITGPSNQNITVDSFSSFF